MSEVQESSIWEPPYKQVPPGTPFINMETGDYPLSFQDVKRLTPSVSWPVEPYYHQFIGLGFGVVEWTDPPAGDHYNYVVEDVPVSAGTEDGIYKRAWKFVPYSPEEIEFRLNSEKQNRLMLLDYRQEEALERGFEHTFSDNTVGHIQMSVSDRVNFLGRLYLADKAKEAGELDTVFTWMTREEELKELFTEEMIALALKCALEYENVLNAKRTLRKQIKECERIEDLPEVPETLN